MGDVQVGDLLEKDLYYACYMFKMRYIKEHLIRNHGNISVTAEKIGVDRSSLTRTIHKMGLEEFAKRKKKSDITSVGSVFMPKVPDDGGLFEAQQNTPNFIESELIDMMEKHKARGNNA